MREKMNENSGMSDRTGMGCGIVMLLIINPIMVSILSLFMWLTLCCVGWSNLTWKGLQTTWLFLMGLYVIVVICAIVKEIIHRVYIWQMMKIYGQTGEDDERE